jgi:hypothetical protein
MSNATLPTIAHADVSFNQWNRVVIQMHDGWVYWDRDVFGRDENGNFIEPEKPEDISYFRYGVYSPTYDFDNCSVVVAESEVPENQIFGDEPETEVM